MTAKKALIFTSTSAESRNPAPEVIATPRDRNPPQMSDQALKGILTFIDVHIFNVNEEMKVTAVGTSEPSSVSVKKSGGEWDRTIRPGDGEEKTLGVSAGDQCFAMNVWIKFENGQKG